MLQNPGKAQENPSRKAMIGASPILSVEFYLEKSTKRLLS